MPATPPEPAAPTLWVARGARAAEAALLDALLDEEERGRRQPELLARPLVVVVPSRSLREHLLAQAVRRAGRPLLGVSVTTLRSLAAGLLARAGQVCRPGERLLPVLVRRHARAEPALREALDELVDGYRAVVSAVSDLLDAGFEPGLEPVAAEALRESGGPGLARNLAMLRVARAVQSDLAKAGLDHRADLFRRARNLVDGGSDELLPARALWIHGYADATGVQTDLLAALVRRGARVVLDEPDDPARPGTPDAGVAFTSRLRERLLQGRERGAAPEPPPAASVELLRAPGAHAEVRAVAERVRALLDAGEKAETIGIVARDLEPYRLPLRLQLARQAVPFSGAPGALGPLSADGRRIRALLDLLRLREATPADRWLDAEEGRGRSLRRDLRVGLHSLGLARLRDVAAFDVPAALGDADHHRLPVRHGFASAEDPTPLEGATHAEQGGRLAPEPDGQLSLLAPVPGSPASVPRPGDGSPAPATPPRNPRRRLRRSHLEAAVERARGLVQRLASWPGSATLGAHLERLEALLGEGLGWSARTGARASVQARFAELREELGQERVLEREELAVLVEHALRDEGRVSFGGSGAGVQVLGVVDARARTFEHLFVLGLNRDLFPRAVTEDALLRDAARRSLGAVLEDIPIKARGFDEERYLFAQLVSASPRVLLSWQAVTDDGKERTPSPLVERLRLARGGEPAPLAPGLFDAPDPDRPRRARCSAQEAAIRAGLLGGSDACRRLLPLALAEAGRGLPLPGAAPDAAALAEARFRILREIEGPPAGRETELGPYFGFVGPAGAGDPRQATLYVTTLESLARCPWQTFLARLLRIEPLPDAHESLPGLEPLDLGNLLHRVLERIVEDAFRAADVAPRATLPELLARPGLDVPWPTAARLEALLGSESREVAREAGIALPGFALLLREKVRPLLERVRELDWPGDVLPGVLGSEAEGQVQVETGAGVRPLHFRVDRVDRGPAGLRLTDYKSGRPVSKAKGADTRRKNLRDAVAKGEKLQAVAYAEAVAPEAAEGRYLFAKVELDPAHASQGLRSEDAELRETFAQAAAVGLQGWQAGSFSPRLVSDGSGSPGCEWCEYSEACLHGDSGARARLVRWLEEDRVPTSPDEAALRALWHIGGRDR